MLYVVPWSLYAECFVSTINSYTHYYIQCLKYSTVYHYQCEMTNGILLSHRRGHRQHNVCGEVEANACNNDYNVQVQVL